jgi:exodeoxyribonuclease-1
LAVGLGHAGFEPTIPEFPVLAPSTDQRGLRSTDAGVPLGLAICPPMTKSLYWHDYETWGTNPRLDRPAQFAGLRTDLDFHPLGVPLVLYCRPADDVLPHPDACLITGLTPQRALAEGVIEADFFAAIHEQLAQPGTCALGYNTLRFDDELTRYGLYRNFYDPYAREWQGGNSRWDLIDVVRLTRALRPEGIEWPVREDGETSFKLEHLTAANGMAHAAAHDALADVDATIALAKLIRERQPRLYDFAFRHRDKGSAAGLLDLRARESVLHVSSRYPACHGCLAVVVPLAPHPTNKNGVVVYDLRYDPTPLLSLDAGAVRRLVYTAAEHLREGEARIPLKVVHLNKCPVLAPLSTLTPEAAERWAIDLDQARSHRAALLAARDLPGKLAVAFAEDRFPPVADPDQALYDGFLSDADRVRCDRVRRTPPAQLAELESVFDDARLPELLFRYRARNWPETLSAPERARWDAWRRQRVRDPASGLTIAEYRRQVARLASDATLTAEQRAVVSALADWPTAIGLQ